MTGSRHRHLCQKCQTEAEGVQERLHEPRGKKCKNRDLTVKYVSDTHIWMAICLTRNLPMTITLIF